MPDCKNDNFAWESHGIAENAKETLLHISRFVQTWGCGAAEITFTSLANVLCLDPQKSRAALPIPSCRVMELLRGTGGREIETEIAVMQMWGCDLGYWGKQEVWEGEAEEEACPCRKGSSLSWTAQGQMESLENISTFWILQFASPRNWFHTTRCFLKGF